MENVHVCYNGISSIHGKKLLEQLSTHQEHKRSHINTNVRQIYKMRSLDWRQIVGRIIHGNTCLWLVTKESSIFSAQRYMSFQILYCVLVRHKRTPNGTMHGNKDWDVSKLHRNTEPSTESTVNQWNSNGILPRIQNVATQLRSQTFTFEIRWDTRISQEGLSSCRCTTTSPMDQETMKKNASQMLNSFLYLQEVLQRDNGHFLVLVQRKRGLLSEKIVHMVNGTQWRKNDVRIRKLRTSNFPCYESTVSRSTQKQWLWKTVDTQLCRVANV